MFFDLVAAIFAGIMIMGFIVYPLLTLLLSKKYNLPTKKDIPKISILIPAHNEEKVIEGKIKNTLNIDYPRDRLEIIVIDSNSTDKTYELASKFPVKLLRAPLGKVNAINQGLNYSKSEIIVITDADITLSKNSLKSMVSHLNGDIGAVGGYVIPEPSFIKGKQEYRIADWKLRYAEGKIDSACNLDGKLVMFKKNLLMQYPQNALTDDYIMTFIIRQKGFRLVVDRDAEVYETMPKKISDEIIQFRRYAKDIMYTNFKNLNFLFNPKYKYYGLMTFPFRRFFPVFYPIFLAYLLIYSYNFFSYLPLILLLAGLSALLIFKKIMLIQMYSIILAYFDLFKRDMQGGKWEKVQR